VLLVLLSACHPAETVGGGSVPETCTANPPVAWAGQTAFTEGTDAWGLTDVHAGRYLAGDLDGDGYPDLVGTELFSNARDNLAKGVQYHFVLLNQDDGAGGRTFVDVTGDSGLLTNRDGGEGTSANVYILGDVDNDGDLDVFAGRSYDAGADDLTGDCSEIYLNDGSAHFTLAAPSDVCIPEGYPTSAAAFTDYDADGVLDLWVTGWYVEYGYYEAAQAHLYRGNGDGTFTDVTSDAGLQLRSGRTDDYAGRDDRRPSYGAAACDVNGDSLPDLLSSNYGRSWNQLWRNDGGSFTDIGEESGFASDDNLDYSDNAFYACYCAVYSGCDPAPTVTCADTSYASYWAAGVDDQPWRLAGNSFTTVCADIDNDGDNDLYTAEIVHDWAGQSADPTQLLLNDGSGTFTRVDNETNGLARRRARTGWNEGDLYAAFFDFDSDGWKDILLVSSDYEDTHLWLWRQVSPGQFEDVSDATGLNQPWPAGIAVADFDRDGDLDVVTGSSTARSGTPWTTRAAHLYENELGGGNWATIAGLPVGTRVEVEAGGVTQMQEVSGSYGTSGILNDVDLTFGLGDGCMIDRISAVYPGGATQEWLDKAGNQRIVLTRDGS
jgi:hypothetical protein